MDRIGKVTPSKWAVRAFYQAQRAHPENAATSFRQIKVIIARIPR